MQGGRWEGLITVQDRTGGGQRWSGSAHDLKADPKDMESKRRAKEDL